MKTKKVSFISTLDSDIYSLKIFNLTSAQTDELIENMTSCLHLNPVARQKIETSAA